MKFTYSWLMDHLETNYTVDKICDQLNMIGLEVEDIDNPIQKYKDLDLLFLDTFNLDDGLKIEDSAGRIRTFDNLKDWIGKRAQAGKLTPKGFPKLN